MCKMVYETFSTYAEISSISESDQNLFFFFFFRIKQKQIYEGQSINSGTFDVTPKPMF